MSRLFRPAKEGCSPADSGCAGRDTLTMDDLSRTKPNVTKRISKFLDYIYNLIIFNRNIFL